MSLSCLNDPITHNPYLGFHMYLSHHCRHFSFLKNEKYSRSITCFLYHDLSLMSLGSFKEEETDDFFLNLLCLHSIDDWIECGRNDYIEVGN